MLYAPLKKPQDFGFKKGDSHIVVNAQTNTAKCYDFSGKKLWEIPCLPQGLHPNWRENSGDTPPGLYKFGQVYRDREDCGSQPSFDPTLQSFGWYSIALVPLDWSVEELNRDGLMAHGGGAGCGWPYAWDPYQTLYCTHGCVRYHNQDMKDKIVPLTDQGTVFMSVYQDDV